MATSKKISTAKKSTTTKRPVAKKSIKKTPPLTKRFYAVTIGLHLLIIATVIVLAFLVTSSIVKGNNQARLDRINEVYSNLSLGDGYIVSSSNVFGQKRTEDKEKGTTQSSSVTYLHADTVTNTLADLDMKIKGAGFTFVAELETAKKVTHYQYKSTTGEQLDLLVSSKPYQDALVNDSVMGGSTAAATPGDANGAPAMVTIKVNLDDKNE